MKKTWQVWVGDSVRKLEKVADNTVDAVVTDPPYGLAFMAQRWDYDVPSVDLWRQCLRVLKPGGHLLAFAGTRTQHRMAVRIEDAGFEIRDMLAWVYGSGFPKSMNVGRAIDRENATPGPVIGVTKKAPRGWNMDGTTKYSDREMQGPGSELSAPWHGWGTTLKPALEPITLARKPLGESNVATNVLRWGTGGLNIDACRVQPTGEQLRGGAMDGSSADKVSAGWDSPWRHDPVMRARAKERSNANQEKAEQLGRFPANLLHDGSDDVLGHFPDTQPSRQSVHKQKKGQGRVYGRFNGLPAEVKGHVDNGGSAARFFYCPKASRAERDFGLGPLPLTRIQVGCKSGLLSEDGKDKFAVEGRNVHPTVKPIELMRYLCRLVTPPGGLILDPFLGSGSTGCAAVLEGYQFLGIDLNDEYVRIARLRIRATKRRS